MFDWADIITPSASLLELVFRGTVTFLALMLLLRLVGQREAGGLGLTDLLVVVLAADAASVGLSGGSETIGDGMVVVCTILFWSLAVDAVSYRWPRLGTVLKARPKVLIRDGVLDRRVMRREFMSRDEVLSQLRLHGVTDEREVHRAFIEPNGMVSVISKAGETTEGTDTPGSPES